MGPTAATAEQRRTIGSLIAGSITILLALVAFFLPDIDFMPRGGAVGWLLVVAGLAEIALAVVRQFDRAGVAALVSGLITGAAGLIFVFNPLASFIPVTNVVMVWLFVRGVAVLLIGIGSPRPARWIAGSGAVDILLGLTLAAGLPVATLVYMLFGPTPALVAKFSLLLAISFLCTGIAQLLISSPRAASMVRGTGEAHAREGF